MKKTFMLVLVCLVCLGLTACDPNKLSYNFIKPEADITSVELVFYDNPNASVINTFIPIIIPRIRSFEFEKMNILEILAPEKLDDFAKDFGEISVWTTWVHLDSPTEDTVRIVYSDGCFDVFALHNDFAGRYDRYGKPVEHWGCIYDQDDLIRLVNDYFSNQGASLQPQK